MAGRSDGFLEDSEIFKGNPESLTNLKGWSASGTLLCGGNKGVVLAANLKTTTAYTLQFYTSGIAAGVTNTFTLAEITWSVKGNSVRRLVSVINGMAVSGMGEGVNVKIYDWSNAGLTPSTYVASVLLAPGVRGTSQRPFLEIDNDFVRGSLPSQNVGALGTGTLNVPLDAGVNSVLLSAGVGSFTAIADDNVVFLQATASNQTLKQMTYKEVGLWIPLSPACTKIIVANNIAKTLIVTPSWGIEG